MKQTNTEIALKYTTVNIQKHVIKRESHCLKITYNKCSESAQEWRIAVHKSDQQQQQHELLTLMVLTGTEAPLGRGTGSKSKGTVLYSWGASRK